VTARVKRQIFVMIGLVGLTLYFVYMLDWMWIALFTPVMWGAIWLVVILMAIITMPFESMIKLIFIQKAKTILANQSRLIKIGITGSYGKTSSKNILNEILAEKYYVLSTPASFNTPMGLTITIREQLKSIHQVFIAEMGADKVGEIDFLSKFIRPQYAIITSIGPQHLNTFKSIDNIIREKMRLVENLPVSGVGVINYDYETIRNYRIKNNCKILTYAIDHDADYRAHEIIYTVNGSSFTVRCAEGDYPFTTRLLGKHNIANILAGIALGRQLGLTWELLQKAVSSVNYVEHRLQLKKINGFNYIDNAFNSNPEGAKMSLEVIKMMPNHRYIVTPGMIDLGVKQIELNKQFGSQMKDHVDTVILVGRKQTLPIYDGLKESGFDMNEVIVLDTVKEAFRYIEGHAHKDDIILLENDLPDAFNH
jgi:UDP-N-acetylmuramoyl-tripeptide--D-alanyl-D-alanine ligase